MTRVGTDPNSTVDPPRRMEHIYRASVEIYDSYMLAQTSSICPTEVANEIKYFALDPRSNCIWGRAEGWFRN